MARQLLRALVLLPLAAETFRLSASEPPSVAILVVGKCLDPVGHSSSMHALRTNSVIVDLMTEDEASGDSPDDTAAGTGVDQHSVNGDDQHSVNETSARSPNGTAAGSGDDQHSVNETSPRSPNGTAAGSGDDQRSVNETSAHSPNGTAAGTGDDQHSVAEPSSQYRSLRDQVIIPLRQEAHVDVSVCTDVLVGRVPPEITRVVMVRAKDQFERALGCYEAVKKSGVQADFWIKLRPDFLYLERFISIGGLDRSMFLSRFRLAQGIAGLTTAHVSWNYCSPRCYGEPETAVGYMNDDMVFVAGSAVVEQVFQAYSVTQQWRSYRRAGHDPLIYGPPSVASGPVVPVNWITNMGLIEGDFTRALLHNGIKTWPLAVLGYPAGSLKRHKRAGGDCFQGEGHSIQKSCFSSLSIDKVHQAIDNMLYRNDTQ